LEALLNKGAKAIQFLGIIVTGVGLIYGIVQNDMRAEFLYLGIGIVIFFAGFVLDRR
jgi:hypothetical protein